MSIQTFARACQKDPSLLKLSNKELKGRYELTDSDLENVAEFKESVKGIPAEELQARITMGIQSQRTMC